MAEWEFSAQIDEDGDLCLEWYASKGNVVTISINAVAHVINWAALIDGKPHHGAVKGYPAIVALGEVKSAITVPPAQEVTDGWGGTWRKCSHSSCDLQVVRPGKVQCSGYCAGAQDDAAKGGA